MFCTFIYYFSEQHEQGREQTTDGAIKIEKAEKLGDDTNSSTSEMEKDRDAMMTPNTNDTNEPGYKKPRYPLFVVLLDLLQF